MTSRKQRDQVPKDNDAFADLKGAFDDPGIPTEGTLGPLDLGLLRTALWIEKYGDLANRVRGWRQADFEASGKRSNGSGGWMPPERIMVLLLVLGLRRQPILFTTLRDMVRDDFTDEAFELLGIERFPEGISDRALYDRLYRPYQHLKEAINPEPGSIRKALTEAEVAVMQSRRDPEECATKKQRANEFVNAVLHGTWMLLPRDVRRRWKGNITIDATFIRSAASHGTTKGRKFCSSDPEAYWYRRDGNHAGSDPTTRAKSKYQRSREAIGWGRELHAAVPYANEPGAPAEVPPIVLGVSFDNPGRNLPHEGALLIEGTWYCPSMPKPLQTASIDYLLTAEGDPRRINDDEYRQRIAQRERYRLRNKEKPDTEGYTRKMCPAAGPSATVVCPLQEQHPKAAAKSGLTHILTLNLVDPAPKVCTNQSTLTFEPQVGAKYEQTHPYKSKTWQLHYTHGRQAVESVNKSIKDGRFQPVDDTERRPRRGWIATLIAVVVMVAATNVRKITRWLLDRQGVPTIDQRPPARRERRRDLTDGYRLAPVNDPPAETAS